MTDKTGATPPHDSYSYAQAGVSIAAGNALVKAIGPLVKATAQVLHNGLAVLGVSAPQKM